MTPKKPRIKIMGISFFASLENLWGCTPMRTSSVPQTTQNRMMVRFTGDRDSNPILMKGKARAQDRIIRVMRITNVKCVL